MNVEDLYNRILEYIHKYKMININDSLLLSLSAGKDSMALLHILKVINSELKCKFTAFHLNHLTRGAENDKDELFIKKVTNQYQIPVYIRKFDFKRNFRGSFEEHARNKRYELLNEIAKKYNCNRIVTAHTLNDNVETILMRLFNGTSLQGIQGILPIRDNIIRPLLSITSREVYGYLKQLKADWREDESNNDNRYTRNYVRNVIIPKIETKFSHYEKSFSNFIRVAYEHNSFFNRIFFNQINKYLIKEGDIIKILIEPEIDEKNYIINMIVLIMKSEFKIYIKKTLLDEIYKKYRVNRSNLVLYKNKKLIIKKIYLNGKKYLQFVNKANSRIIDEWTYNINLDFSKEKIINLNKPGLKIVLKWANFDEFKINMYNSSVMFLNFTQSDNLVIRNRVIGDKIISRSGKYIKIKKYCIDNKCSAEEKKRLPIFIVDGILVAAGFGFINKGNNRINHNFFVNSKTKKILAIYCTEKI